MSMIPTPPPASITFMKPLSSILVIPPLLTVVFLSSHPAAAEQGGPDQYGYTWDSSIPFEYAYAQFTYFAVEVHLADDDTQLVDIGFDFLFYGNYYNEITISSNGLLLFVDSDSVGYVNYSLPTGTNVMIVPFWDDLDPSTSGHIYHGVQGTAPNRVAIFEWYDVSDFSQAGSASFEVKLYEQDGSIEFHYLDTVFGDAGLDYGASATIGIQDGTLSGYELERSYNAPVAGNQSAVRFERCWDNDGDGYLDLSCAADDCDDGDASVYPGATEICNQLDDDCDGDVDEEGALGCSPFYLDYDGDGYGLAGEERCLCDAITPYDSQQVGDCDDANPDTHPSAPELCDGEDNDCEDGPEANEIDADADGWMLCANDCDDSDASTHPNAPELCDGVDNDCDYSLPSSETDEDADGYLACDGDCDDSSASVHPGIVEEDTCDGLDSNCDGWIAEDEADGDQDGFMVCEDDCDDTDPDTFPSDALDGLDVCDGIDNNCDGLVDEDSLDSDGDGVTICGGDCDDSESYTHLGAPEICDGKDNDCDGAVPNNEKDVDGDGYRICEGDCADNDEDTNPGAAEECDGIDNDCNGGLPAEEVDPDVDGVMACDGDCDETQGTGHLVSPDSIEDCTDGLDNDCDGEIDGEDPDCAGDASACFCSGTGSAAQKPVLGVLLVSGALFTLRRYSFRYLH